MMTMLSTAARTIVAPRARSVRHPRGAGARPYGLGRVVTAAVYSAGADSDTLVLYTKPGCCLCDGLKDTLGEVMSGKGTAGLGATLQAMTLEIRDVSTNDAWAERYATEVPVLTLLPGTDGEKEAGREIPLPRPAPRLSPARLAIRLEQDVSAALAGKSGTRKGWARGATVGEKEQPATGGGGWTVVSGPPF